MVIGACAGIFGSHFNPNADFTDVSTRYTVDGGLWPTDFKLEFSNGILDPLALISIRLSLLFFYRRVFIHSVIHNIAWLLVGIVILWGVAFPIFLTLSCWNMLKKDFKVLHCDYPMSAQIIYGIVDTTVDFTIFFIPIPLVFSMLIPLKRKLAILGALLVGSLAISFAFFRLLILSHSALGPDDKVQWTTLTEYLIACQIGVGLIAICLPILGPNLLRHSRLLLGRISSLPSSLARDREAARPAADPSPMAEKNGRSATLGSLNTRNFERYAMGRVCGDEGQALTISSGTNDVLLGNATADSLR